MSRSVKVSEKFKEFEFLNYYKIHRSKPYVYRCLACYYIQIGRTYDEVAELLHYSRNSIMKWVEKFEQEGNLRRVFIAILVDRDTHKSMVIGNKGARLKDISTQARQDMEKLFDGPVYLEIWVKVKSGWADNEAGLRAYGYE